MDVAILTTKQNLKYKAENKMLDTGNKNENERKELNIHILSFLL